MSRYILSVIDTLTMSVIRLEGTSDETIFKSWCYNGEKTQNEAVVLPGDVQKGAGRPPIALRYRYEHDPLEKPTEVKSAIELSEAFRLPLTTINARLRRMPRWRGEATFPHIVIGEFRVWRAQCEDACLRKQLRDHVQID